MKLYTHKFNPDGTVQRIYGMSVTRPRAKDILSENAKTLQEHILKCVVYGDSTHNFDYWIETEISQYLYMADKVTLKPDASKCKPDMYINTIFGHIGDAEVDAELDLEMFLSRIKQKKIDYPIFTITNDMTRSLYNVYMDIIDSVLPILTNKAPMSKSDFYPIIHKILDPYRYQNW